MCFCMSTAHTQVHAPVDVSIQALAWQPPCSCRHPAAPVRPWLAEHMAPGRQAFLEGWGLVGCMTGCVRQGRCGVGGGHLGQVGWEAAAWGQHGQVAEHRLQVVPRNEALHHIGAVQAVDAVGAQDAPLLPGRGPVPRLPPAKALEVPHDLVPQLVHPAGQRGSHRGEQTAMPTRAPCCMCSCWGAKTGMVRAEHTHQQGSVSRQMIQCAAPEFRSRQAAVLSRVLSKRVGFANAEHENEIALNAQSKRCRLLTPSIAMQ